MILEVFLFSAHAVLPLLFEILLGWLLAHLHIWSAKFFSELNKLCFRVLFPISLFVNVYAIEDLSVVNVYALLYMVFGVLFCCAIGVVAARLFVPDRAQKGVVVQASFRSSQAVLGLSVVEALGGAGDALAFASLATAFGVPLFNMLSVIVLNWYGGSDGKKTDLKAMLKKIATNPMIIGAFIGLGCVLVEQLLIPRGASGVPLFTIRYTLPDIYSFLGKMGKAAQPMALMALGTQLDFGRVGKLAKPLALCCFLRLVFCPALVFTIAALVGPFIGMGVVEFPALISSLATPLPTPSVIMAEEAGCDAELAGQAVVWSNALSMGTMCICIFVLRLLGLI